MAQDPSEAQANEGELEPDSEFDSSSDNPYALLELGSELDGEGEGNYISSSESLDNGNDPYLRRIISNQWIKMLAYLFKINVKKGLWN